MYAVSGSVSKASRAHPGLGIEGQADSPHDARSAWVRQSLVLTNQLDGQPASRGRSLEVIVKVEILSCPSHEPGLPALGNKERGRRIRRDGFKTLNSPHQSFC